MSFDARPAWREELDAIVGARSHGQFNQLLPRLEALDRRHPNVAEIAAQIAWTCETLGRLDAALPAYEKAIALGLPPNELSNAYLGLGATLRALGQLDRSAAILRAARLQFPDNRELDVFLALTLHAQGRSGEALALVLEALCDTTEDPGLTAYGRAIRHAAAKLT
ncbi:tetratricopeptide repeat protein [Horticoccus luteus]|uniref:Tetratricopeptide repeat protein n=1 Tax=Horticoccus luteus TaxID=2862869 RepID=A0A8F9TWQ3_9BACT|nr:tetratricopeptide repeat protein [Horticoccus luteus]QYM79678.1 tetratricopeptide repeat protein [Horticoccus luteus]